MVLKPVGKASNGDKTESCVSLMLLLNSALRKQAKERFSYTTSGAGGRGRRYKAYKLN